LLRKRWWSEGEEGSGSFWSLRGGLSLDVRRRLEEENVAVAEILGVGGLGRGEEGGEHLAFGAKKREITCCFCFPMAILDLARFFFFFFFVFYIASLTSLSLSLFKVTVTWCYPSFSSYKNILFIC